MTYEKEHSSMELDQLPKDGSGFFDCPVNWYLFVAGILIGAIAVHFIEAWFFHG